MAGPCQGKKEEGKVSKWPASVKGKKEMKSGMTETDLNGRQDDRDGPKWPAPARVKGMVGWEDRNGPKWPAPARGRGGVKWDDRDGPKWPAR